MTFNSNSRKLFALGSFLMWLSLVILVFIDSTGQLGQQGDVLVALQEHSFTRIMFADIGALSTVAAIWIFFSNNNLKSRFLFAPLTLFVGSFSLLLYLVVYFLATGDEATKKKKSDR